MRRLFLLRHAAAERVLAGQSDLDRPLADDGLRDATAVGTYLARHGDTPGCVAVSPALRTRQTLAAALPHATATTVEQRIYDARPATLMSVIKGTPDRCHSLMLIGHNPGLHEFAILLTGTGDIDMREQLREKFPTCALAVIDLALDSWAKIHAQAGRLERFVTPKSLARVTG
jgi:phosphohistidine phosphatase